MWWFLHVFEAGVASPGESLPALALLGVSVWEKRRKLKSTPHHLWPLKGAPELPRV